MQILKREWPKNWESFIPDIIGASKTNESLCQNNMVILKLLSEEVFDFSSGQMTQTKAKHLKDTMCSQFSDVFQLCQFVLDNSQNAPLVGVTLETLLRFLNWIPLGYIFETKLINTLIFKFLNVPMFRNVTLKCLSDIAAVTVPHYDEIFVTMFTQTMAQLEQMLPVETNIREAYANGQVRFSLILDARCETKAQPTTPCFVSGCGAAVHPRSGSLLLRLLKGAWFAHREAAVERWPPEGPALPPPHLGGGRGGDL